MDAKPDAIYLMGDLSDPWVSSIGDGFPARYQVNRVDCPEDVPDRAFSSGRPPLLIVVHRNRLCDDDARRIVSWRGIAAPHESPLVVLCVSPYVRYEELERWRGIADIVLSDATARDILPARLSRRSEGRRDVRARTNGPPFRVEVAGSIDAVCSMVVEACAGAGYRVRQVSDLLLGELAGGRRSNPSSSERVLTIWDVPVLEPGWPDQLERRVRQTGPVITLLGFADRASVTVARGRGAAACLELPFDFDDLFFLIDRTVENRPIETWPVPARLEPPHLLPPRSRQRAAAGDVPSAGPPWSDHDRQPTIA
jgi:hypothetical protein